MDKIKKLKIFLQKNYPNIQAFNTRNIVGDKLTTVYKEDNITVDYCSFWDYIEIFGLTNKQFDKLLNKKSFGGDNLKTFRINRKEK